MVKSQKKDASQKKRNGKLRIWKTDYSKIARYYDRMRGRGGIHHGGWTKVAEYGDIGSAKLVLDIGCGTGSYNIAYSKHYTARFIGMDNSQHMLHCAMKKDPKRNIDWVLGNAESLPFRIGIFDIVYMTFVIHHIDNRKKASTEFRRVLRNDGYLIIMTSSHGRLRRTPWSLFPGVYGIDSRRFPTIPKLIGVLKVAGFRGVRSHRVVFGYQKLSLNRALKFARQKLISTFTLINEKDFKRGVKIFEKRIRKKHGNRIDRELDANFVVGVK